ncbi:MAG: FtsX-like permease family protein [Phycisphaerae bacterium]
MLKIFLWLRYLRKKKIVLLSIAAVAVSVALMVVVDGLFTGYIDAIRQMTTADTGDISFWMPGGEDKINIFLNSLEQDPNITAVAPFMLATGLLHMNGGIVREVGIYGIDPVREQGFADWHERLLRQKSPAQQPDFSVPDSNDTGVWLGINVIAEPNEQTDEYDFSAALDYIGERVILTTIGKDSKRRVEPYTVSDIAFTQTFFGDKTLYMSLEQFRLLRFGELAAGQPPIIKLKIKKGVEPRDVFPAVERIWRDFAVEQLSISADEVPYPTLYLSQDWYANIFEDLQNQKAIVLLIFGVICSVGVLLIFCIFYMIVTTRLKDIAIIKSCGASGSTAAVIFGGFGIIVGIIGSALGVLFGYIIIKNINTLEEWVRIIFGMKLWRTSSYGLAEIPHNVHWPWVPWFVLIALAGCLLGVLIPSLIAAMRSPVKILRYE